MQKTVPILITFDIDPLTKDERIRYGISLKEEQTSLLEKSLERVSDLTSELGIRSTFFVTASLCEEIEDELEELLKKKHQIGCHGLTHGDDENFAKLPYEEQLYRIEKATRILESFVGKVTAFRAPGVRISSTTLKILENLGYTADSSISSQRFDLASSNMNPKLIFAPRLPYHPKDSDAFRKGSMKIWEIPISAIVLPFISGTLSVFGFRFMKRFFNVLYRESQRTGKPIVYLTHPTEFLASENYSVPASWFFSLQMWSVQGNPIRYFLFRRDGKVLFEEHKELFAYMKTFEGIKFMTVDEYNNTRRSEKSMRCDTLNSEESRKNNKDREEYFKKYFNKSALLSKKDFEVAGWSEHGMNRRILTFLRIFTEEVKEKKKVIDIGCGPGTYDRILADMGHDVTGTDYSESMIKVAIEKSKVDSNINYIITDSYSLPFKEASFDVAICIGLLQYITNEADAITEIKRILKDEGILILITLNSISIMELYNRIKRDTSISKLYNPFKLKKLFKTAGFDDIKVGGVYIFPRMLRGFEPLFVKEIFKHFEQCLFLLWHAFIIKGVNVKTKRVQKGGHNK